MTENIFEIFPYEFLFTNVLLIVQREAEGASKTAKKNILVK